VVRRGRARGHPERGPPGQDAALLIHEQRLSIVEIVRQMGHDPNACLSRHTHVMAELDGDRGASPEEHILAVRRAKRSSASLASGPDVAHDK
jgi:hypothetical protein